MHQAFFVQCCAPFRHTHTGHVKGVKDAKELKKLSYAPIAELIAGILQVIKPEE